MDPDLSPLQAVREWASHDNPPGQRVAYIMSIPAAAAECSLGEAREVLLPLMAQTTTPTSSRRLPKCWARWVRAQGEPSLRAWAAGLASRSIVGRACPEVGLPCTAPCMTAASWCCLIITRAYATSTLPPRHAPLSIPPSRCTLAPPSLPPGPILASKDPQQAKAQMKKVREGLR